MELHHLFPRAYLERKGITDLKLINQVANLTYLEWPKNITIKDDSPDQYVPIVRQSFSDEEWNHMNHMHALPENWHLMEYGEFLKARRILLAQIIKKGFESFR